MTLGVYYLYSSVYCKLTALRNFNKSSFLIKWNYLSHFWLSDSNNTLFWLITLSINAARDSNLCTLVLPLPPYHPIHWDIITPWLIYPPPTAPHFAISSHLSSFSFTDELHCTFQLSNAYIDSISNPLLCSICYVLKMLEISFIYLRNI